VQAHRTTESRELDLLIVGGGPAGLSTWLHLHREDPGLAARTLLIEKAVYPRDKLCGGGVVPQADQVLCDLGIDLHVPSVLIQHVDYVFGPNRLRWSPGNAFRVVRRYEFDHALARAAVKRGLTLNEGEAFRRFERSGQRLVVETTRGRYRVRALIGADGASSVVRRAMNLRERPRMSRLLEVVPPVLSENPLDAGSDTAVFDFSAVAQGLQGYVWRFPCLVAGVPSFNRGIYDSRVYPDRVPAKLNKVFAEALKGQASFSEPSTWSAHPERWFDPEGMYAQPNVLLVGDAAGVEPTFGEGISYALRYGAIAAQYLVRSYERSDFSFQDYRDRLLASPMGITLLFQAISAKQMYADAPDALDRLHRRFAQELGVEATPQRSLA
jgi:flavin-dependent dehydrogenase